MSFYEYSNGMRFVSPLYHLLFIGISWAINGFFRNLCAAWAESRASNV